MDELLPTLPVMLKYWHALGSESWPFQQELCNNCILSTLCPSHKWWSRFWGNTANDNILLALAELLLDFERQLIRIHNF